MANKPQRFTEIPSTIVKRPAKNHTYITVRWEDRRGTEPIALCVQVGTGYPTAQILAGNWAQNPSTGPDTVGVFRPSLGQFYLQFTNTQGIADIDFPYGNQAMVAVHGSFGALPGGDAAPTPAWIEPYKPPPAPYGLAITEAAAAGTSCYDAAAKALYCKIRIEARYDGAPTDKLYMSITDPGESVVRNELGYPPGHGILSPGAGGIFETTRSIPVNTEKCYWITAVRWYPDDAGGSVATFSATIGPVCGTVDTENRLIEPGTVTPPVAPDSITFSRIETPSPSGPADLWFDVAIPEKLAEGYLCVTPVTPGAGGFLPPREMCTDVSGRDPGTYEVEADGQVDWRGGWAAYVIIPGAESASTSRVWGTPQWVDTWIPG